MARFFERLGSFSRLIIFDKRGTGLSDPVAEVPTLEQRIDDVRAVMDAAGSERAALFGISEGGPMSVLFAATHPERVTALVLHGAMGRTTEAPDYPWASPAEALRESAAEFIAPYWGQDAEGMVELFSPSFAGDPQAAEYTARFERSSASPAMVQQIFEMFLDIDVRAILPTIHVPTLVTPPARRPGGQLARGRGARRADPGRPLRRATRDRPHALGGRLGAGARGDRGVPDRHPLGGRARPRARHGDVHGHRAARPRERRSSGTRAGASCSRRIRPRCGGSWSGSADVR